MDENLVVYAIQFKNEDWFNDRYRRFKTEKERDDRYQYLIERLSSETKETVARVNLIIRVETLKEGETNAQ